MKKHFIISSPSASWRSEAGRGLLLLLPLLAALWLALMLPACKKDDPGKTILHGRVIEYGTKEPMADARIYVGCEESVPFGPSTFTLVDSLITDADGKFYKEYAEADLCFSSSLIPYKKGYFKGTSLYPTTDNKAFEVVLDPEAWLKVVTVPNGTIGHLFVGGNFDGGGGFESFASQGVSERIFSTNGNRYKQIRWRPYGQVDMTKTDSLYLPAHDTTSYTIHY